MLKVSLNIFLQDGDVQSGLLLINMSTSGQSGTDSPSRVSGGRRASCSFQLTTHQPTHFQSPQCEMLQLCTTISLQRTSRISTNASNLDLCSTDCLLQTPPPRCPTYSSQLVPSRTFPTLLLPLTVAMLVTGEHPELAQELLCTPIRPIAPTT